MVPARERGRQRGGGVLHETGLPAWDQLCADRGFRWELIHSPRAPDGAKCISIRLTKKMRAVVKRDADFLEFLTLHPDHDCAYTDHLRAGGPCPAGAGTRIDFLISSRGFFRVVYDQGFHGSPAPL